MHPSTDIIKSLLVIALGASAMASPLVNIAVHFPTPLQLHETNVPPQRQCADTCGSTCYSQADIDAAVQDGFSHVSSPQGHSSYPHKYNDYEGFSFPDPAPYYEYPILASEQAYSGGSPGADRVIFDGNGKYEGVITHQGASGNDFVQCVAGGN